MWFSPIIWNNKISEKSNEEKVEYLFSLISSDNKNYKLIDEEISLLSKDINLKDYLKDKINEKAKINENDYNVFINKITVIKMLIITEKHFTWNIDTKVNLNIEIVKWLLKNII